jgi:hypothetical protein
VTEKYLSEKYDKYSFKKRRKEVINEEKANSIQSFFKRTRKI